MASVWFDGPKGGPYKVRYRDGTRDDAGRPKKLYLGTYYTAMERDRAIAEKSETLDAITRKNRKATATSKLIPEVLDLWAAHQLSVGKIKEPYALEVKGTLKALAEARSWVTLADVTLDAVELWRSSRPDGRGVRKPLAMIQRLLRWAAKAPLRQRLDPEVLIIERGRHVPRPQPNLLSDDQVRAIIERAYERGESCGALVEHLARFGCRSCEAAKLLVRCWDPVARTIRHDKTKNGQPIAPHPVADEVFAKRLDRLTAGRSPDEALYLNHLGKAWACNARGKYQQVIDWYWGNVGLHIEISDPKHRGIGCLKDYAISVMDQEGIDDATKALFTGHLTLEVFRNHYLKSNQDRAAAAAAKIAARSRALAQVVPV